MAAERSESVGRVGEKDEEKGMRVMILVLPRITAGHFYMTAIGG